MEAGLYDDPPVDLVPPVRGARQFSPLFPGSEPLERVPPLSLDSFTLLAPPGTIERRYTLALALRSLKPGAELLALAPKDKGGSRIRKELEEFGCETEEDSRRHHRICRALRAAGAGEDAAEPDRALEPAIREGSPLYLDELGAWTQPGVFSWDRLDAGTSLLLGHLPLFSGFGADLGAGLGYLSRAVLGSAKVKQLHLVELDRRAVDCARKNVADARAAFHWMDLRLSAPALPPLDFVVTNPPFHAGGAEDQSLGQEFLRKAASLLKPGGVAWIVANRHLPYESVMGPLFASVRVAAEERGFKVFEARK